MTYTQAMTELNEIIKDLGKTEEIDMDKISLQVKRATELVEICEKKLHEVDQNIEKMLKEIEKKG